MTEGAIELIQFPYSHYNEKVRWTLAHKRLPHARRNLLPGPHAPTVLRLTGQTQTPVVRFADRVVAGSAAIIDELERRFPERPLYPADPALRRRALALQAWADAEIGPMTRRGLFAVILRQPAYVCALFAGERSATTRALYRFAFPATRLAMARAMGLGGEASVAESHAAVQAALDRLAGEIGPRGTLVGDELSVADVAVASLLVPAVRVEHPAMRPIEPLPDALAAWYDRWTAHPAAAWVRETYQRHRPPDA
jgi:glutathione S-transferase